MRDYWIQRKLSIKRIKIFLTLLCTMSTKKLKKKTMKTNQSRDRLENNKLVLISMNAPITHDTHQRRLHWNKHKLLRKLLSKGKTPRTNHSKCSIRTRIIAIIPKISMKNRKYRESRSSQIDQEINKNLSQRIKKDCLHLQQASRI